MNEAWQGRIARQGIHRIEIPNCFSGLKTNCFYIEDTLPTLIDAGLATDDAFEALTDGISAAGGSIRDLKRIILTHGHADHRALAARIREESGAEVFCHELEAVRVTEPSREQKEWKRNRERALFQSMGVPSDLLEAIVEEPNDPAVLPRLDQARLLRDDDEILFDNFVLRVIHTPGHSSGSICLADEQSRLLFTGDTLLPSFRVTPLIDVDSLEDDGNYNPLKLHIESLQKLLGLNFSLILPGHGEACLGFGKIVETILNRHRKRQLHILRSLRHGRRTPYEICRSVFLFLPPDDLYLALSEVAGNLGILVDEKRVLKQQSDDAMYYQKV